MKNRVVITGMGTGIYLSDGSSFQDAFSRFKEYVFEYQDIDGIFFTSSSVDNKELYSNHRISFPYYQNTLLKLPFKNFEDYLSGRKKKKRWDIKNKIKKFHEKGCSVEIVLNSHITDKEYEKLFELHQNTEENNPETINYLHYSNVDKLKSLSILDDNYQWIIARQFGKIIAFALLVVDNNFLIFKHVGLDYSVNRETYSYFNLFFSAIKFAIENGFQFMQCGSTTYEAKISLGCQLIDREASIIFNEKKAEHLLEFFEFMQFGGSKNE